jgi:hypothetical protein
MPDISRQALQAIAADIETALAAVAKKHGVSIKRGHGVYGSQASLKLEILPIAADGTVITAEAEHFKSAAKYWGLSADDLGRRFRSNGRVFTITGLRPKARTRPLQAQGDDGKTYVFTPGHDSRFHLKFV